MSDVERKFSGSTRPVVPTTTMYFSVAALFACAWSTNGLADEIGIISTLSTYRTDNVLRDSTVLSNRMSNVFTATVGTYGNKQSERLKTEWSAGIVYQSYTDDRLDPQTYGDMIWTLDAQIVPHRFIWKMKENLGEIVVDPGLPDTPLNRAKFNTFMTGPLIQIPMTEKMGFTASALATDSDYELNDFGGKSNTSELGITRLLSTRSSAAVRVAHTDGEFNSKAIGDYNTDKAYVHFETNGGITKLTADFGVNRAQIPVVTGNMPFYQLEMTRTLETGSKLQFSLSRLLTNDAEQFGNLAGTPQDNHSPGNTDETNRPIDLNTVDALYDGRITSVRYLYNQGLTYIQVGVKSRVEKPLAGQGNGSRTFNTIDGSWYRKISSKTGIRLWADFTERTLESTVGRVDRDTEVGIEFAKPIYSVAFRWVLDLSRYSRNSTDPTVEYTEYRLTALLRYSKFIFQPRRRDVP